MDSAYSDTCGIHINVKYLPESHCFSSSLLSNETKSRTGTQCSPDDGRPALPPSEAEGSRHALAMGLPQAIERCFLSNPNFSHSLR